MFRKLFRAALVLVMIVFVGLTAFWFARPADVSFESLKSTVPHAEFSHFADIGGVRIHYQDKGTGTPLVLIHGYTSSTYTWKDDFDQLAERYRVIAVDLKGFGFSGKPDGDYSRKAQGEIVAQLLDHLQIPKAWLAGNSMGGETAINVAIYHPEKVLGLILIDSAGVKFEAVNNLVPWYLQLPIVGRVVTALALTSDGIVREGLEKSFFDDSKIDAARVSYYHEPLRTRDGQRAAVSARLQFELYPVEDKLSSIKVPTLILWGIEDEVIPVANGRKMHELITGSELVEIRNCGHLPQEEMPERVIHEIVSFIEPANRL